MAIIFLPVSLFMPCDGGAADAVGRDLEDFGIRLKSRYFTPRESRQGAASTISAEMNSQSRVHVFMQFRNHPDPETRIRLNEMGVLLLNYLPKNTWFASIPVGLDPDHSALSTVRWIGRILPEDKLSPSIRDAAAGDGTHVENDMIALTVKYFSDVDPAALRDRLADLSAVVLSETSLLNAVSISIALEKIMAVAGDDAVRWIEPVGSAPQMESDRVRLHVQVDLAQNMSLTGKDIRVGVFEDGHVFHAHPDFDARVMRPDLEAGDSPAWHATNVAGIIGGSGLHSHMEFGNYFQWRGMAPDAHIYSYSFSDGNSTGFTNDVAHAVAAFDIQIANNSWGASSCDTYGAYSGLCPFLDDVVHGGHNAPFGGRLPIVFSAGNDRDGYGPGNDLNCDVFINKTAPFANYGTINQPKAAKNIITVGAVDSLDNAMTVYSSWGPTADGRLKPDIVASGHDAGILTNGVSKETANHCRLGGSSYITPTCDAGFPFTGTHTGPNGSDVLDYKSDVYGTNALVGFILTNTSSGQSCIIRSQTRFGTVYCQTGTTITWNTNDTFSIDREYGCFGQTSNAAAATSGAIALLLEDYYDFNLHWPLSSTIKALLIHSALDLNDSTNNWANKGPDFASGYGLLRIQDAIASRLTHGFIEQRIWYRQTSVIWPQQMHYRFDVPAGTPNVKATLVWDDEPGTENASHALVSDLDLILRDPDGGIHYPWTLDPDNPSAPAVRTKSDHINNVEQVLVDASIIPGSWEAIVIGTDVNDYDGYQGFSLVGQTFTPSLNCDHAKVLTLDVPYSNVTRVSDESNVMHYPPFTLGMDGPEVVHQITTTCVGDLRVSLTGTTGNLWVFLLTDCDPRSTLDWAAAYYQYPFAEYSNAPVGTYYVVVDSPDGQNGQYTLTASLDDCRPTGDFNDDGDSDGADLSDLADEFGSYCRFGCLTNLNDDGRVDHLDLEIFAPGFGRIERRH